MEADGQCPVDTSVFTTFYVGVLTNLPQVQSRKQTPHFEFLFRVSYGMSRDQLEIYNQNIRYGRWKTKSFDRDDPFKQVNHGPHRLPGGTELTFSFASEVAGSKLDLYSAQRDDSA